MYCKTKLTKEKIYENEIVNIRSYIEFIETKEVLAQQIYSLYAMNRKEIFGKRIREQILTEHSLIDSLDRKFSILSEMITNECTLLNVLLVTNIVLSRNQIKQIESYFNNSSENLGFEYNLNVTNNLVLNAINLILFVIEESLQTELKQLYKNQEDIKGLYSLSIKTAAFITKFSKLNEKLCPHELNIVLLARKFSEKFTAHLNQKTAETTAALQKYSLKYEEILASKFQSPLGASFYSDFQYTIIEINNLCSLYENSSVKMSSLEPIGFSMTDQVLQFFNSWADFEINDPIVLVKLINLVNLLEYDLRLNDRAITCFDIKNEIISFTVSKLAQQTVRHSGFESELEKSSTTESMMETTDKLLQTGNRLTS